MEKLTSQPNFVSIEESEKLAEKLLVEFEEKIRSQAGQDINGWNPPHFQPKCIKMR